MRRLTTMCSAIFRRITRHRHDFHRLTGLERRGVTVRRARRCARRRRDGRRGSPVLDETEDVVLGHPPTHAGALQTADVDPMLLCDFAHERRRLGAALLVLRQNALAVRRPFHPGGRRCGRTSRGRWRNAAGASVRAGALRGDGEPSGCGCAAVTGGEAASAAAAGEASGPAVRACLAPGPALQSWPRRC